MNDPNCVGGILPNGEVRIVLCRLSMNDPPTALVGFEVGAYVATSHYGATSLDTFRPTRENEMFVTHDNSRLSWLDSGWQ